MYENAALLACAEKLDSVFSELEAAREKTTEANNELTKWKDAEDSLFREMMKLEADMINSVLSRNRPPALTTHNTESAK